jgi:hypothetical protein
VKVEGRTIPINFPQGESIASFFTSANVERHNTRFCRREIVVLNFKRLLHQDKRLMHRPLAVLSR